MEQKFILVPREGLPKHFALVIGITLITMLAVVVALVAAAYMGDLRRGLNFSIPDDFLTTLLITTLAVLLLIFFAAFVSANHELIWVHDPEKGEIRLEEWYYGSPVFTRRYPHQEVAGVRVWWQRTFSGSDQPVTDNPGWWKAALVFWNGKSIHLHAERGGPESVPSDWLERFARACKASSVELKREPASPPAMPPTTSIVNKLKRRQ